MMKKSLKYKIQYPFFIFFSDFFKLNVTKHGSEQLQSETHTLIPSKVQIK